MRLSRRITRHLICLTSLLAFASTPLLAQQGIDLLDPEQVLRAGEQSRSDGSATVRGVLDEAPNGVPQAAHERETIRYDDGEFENFEENSPLSPPASYQGVAVGGTVEWAQRFVVKADGTVVSARVCFLRPAGDLSRALDFNLRFYEDDTVNRVDYPGRRSGLRYAVESDIRRAGTHSCVLLRGQLVGKPLGKGAHWVGIEWNPATTKRLAGDHYTADDEADTDRLSEAVHETEIRRRVLPVLDGANIDGWENARDSGPRTTASGLKAIGVSLVLETTHAAEPDPTPDPTPDPDPTPPPTPDPTPEPDPNPGVITPPPTGAGYSACRPTVAPLTFEGGIKVSLCYDTMKGDMGDAESVYGSENSGLLYFFDPDNAEVFVKVLDGCRLNGRRWVYMAALTDVAFNMYVNDGRNPTKAYHNRSGENHALVQDQMAFPCAP